MKSSCVAGRAVGGGEKRRGEATLARWATGDGRRASQGCSGGRDGVEDADAGRAARELCIELQESCSELYLFQEGFTFA